MTLKQKRILIVSGGVTALFFAVITALLFFMDVNIYRPRIEAAVTDSIGMDFKIGARNKYCSFPPIRRLLGGGAYKDGGTRFPLHAEGENRS